MLKEIKELRKKDENVSQRLKDLDIKMRESEDKNI